MTLSIVIITRSRRQLLEKCLQSLARSSYQNFQLIVGINGPDLESSQLLEDHPLRPTILSLEQAVPPAEARNRALTHCYNEYVLFLDDDTELPVDYLKQGLHFAISHPDIDVFGGPDAVHPKASIVEKSWSLALRSPLLTAHTRKRHHAHGERPRPCDETSLILCAMWFKRSLFTEEAFYFDPHYFRNEENILLYHLAARGKKIYYHPELAIIHRKRSKLSLALRGVFYSGYFRAQSIGQKQCARAWPFMVPTLAMLSFFPLLYFFPSFFVALIFSYLFAIAVTSFYYSERTASSFSLVAVIHPLVHISYGLGMLCYTFRLRSTIVKLTAVILSLAFICELLLQLTSIIVVKGEVKLAEKPDQQAIRILTLGESTTDRRFQTENLKAWPEYLEEMAQAKGIPLVIYNHGQAGISSNQILKDLEMLLNHYQPNFVITMMGINDRDGWVLNITSSFWGKSKLYRLLSWICYTTLNKLSYHPLEWGSDWTSPPELSKLSSKELAQYYAAEARKILPFYPLPLETSDPESKYALAKKYFEQSLSTGHFVHQTLGSYLWLLSREQNYNQCSSVIHRYLDVGGRLDFNELTIALNCLENREESLELLRYNREHLSFLVDRSVEFGNYQNVHRQILQSGATHLIMQYPLRSIDLYRELFTGEERTYFVENKKNFEEALKVHQSQQIFTDHFAGDFGHTTKLGHQLIAKQVLQTLLKLIDTKL